MAGYACGLSFGVRRRMGGTWSHDGRNNDESSVKRKSAPGRCAGALRGGGHRLWREEQRRPPAGPGGGGGRGTGCGPSGGGVYHQQWEEQQKALPTAGTVTWVSPATGTFNAAAYTGSTGAANIPYWKRQNDDVVGWLRVPGTNIDWPIVQNLYDVNYYTKKGYDKQYSFNGVIWTNPGTRTSASASGLSSNTVIYGHNWTNCTASPRVGYSGDVMFAQLTGYHWLSMAQSYPYFYYSTAEGGQFTVKIFACFYTELAFIYNDPEGNMDYIIKEAQRRSRHTFDVDVNSSDKIVTLSTCTRAYGQTSNQRFVVMGRLLRPGETVGPVAISANLNHKQPSVWG